MKSVFDLYKDCLLAEEGIRFKKGWNKNSQIIKTRKDMKLLINKFKIF
jgi:hypothetical protein